MNVCSKELGIYKQYIAYLRVLLWNFFNGGIIDQYIGLKENRLRLARQQTGPSMIMRTAVGKVRFESFIII